MDDAREQGRSGGILHRCPRRPFLPESRGRSTVGEPRPRASPIGTFATAGSAGSRATRTCPWTRLLTSCSAFARCSWARRHGALVSHQTAASLFGLQIPLAPEDVRVHLTVPPPTRVRNRADRRIHVSAVPAAQIQRRAGVALTSPGRTWLDLAAHLPPGALLAVTDQMLARSVSADAASTGCSRPHAGVRGKRIARAVLAVADPLAGSPMESVLRWLIHEAGLPAPVLQHVVQDGDGRFARSGGPGVARPAGARGVRRQRAPGAESLRRRPPETERPGPGRLDGAALHLCRRAGTSGAGHRRHPRRSGPRVTGSARRVLRTRGHQALITTSSHDSVAMRPDQNSSSSQDIAAAATTCTSFFRAWSPATA